MSLGRSLPVWLSAWLVLASICLLIIYVRYVVQRGSSCERENHNRATMSTSKPLDHSRASPSRTTSAQPSEMSAAVEQDAKRQGIKQPYDAFLVLDVEATCVDGPDTFGYPNEIIEWPVCLLRWKDKQSDGTARELEVVDEFRSFVKPTWRPELSQFCKDLTGITQGQVDSAPTFTAMLNSFTMFMEKHGLIEPITSRRLIRYCWCSDGPFDIRDFVVKQCFISKVRLPAWITGDVLDVRRMVRALHAPDERNHSKRRKSAETQNTFTLPTRMSLSLERQLHILGIGPFQGRQHSGIDDTRNVARIVVELARKGVRLEPNTAINPSKRWPWMGRRGKILDGYH